MKVLPAMEVLLAVAVPLAVALLPQAVLLL